jgi:hypothetical protein
LFLEQAAAAGELGGDHEAFNASDVRHDMAAMHNSLQGLFFFFFGILWDMAAMYNSCRTTISQNPLYRDLIWPSGFYLYRENIYIYMAIKFLSI